MEALPRILSALLLLVSAASLGACGEDKPAPLPAELSLADEAPDPPSRCAQTGPAEKVVLTAADGVELAGARFGSGRRGVVLIHQRGSDLCGWWTDAQRWAQAGYHVLAIDLRCGGYSDCGDTQNYLADTTAATAELRRQGAEKVVLIGASIGAATALVAGARLAEQINGVVSLSAHSSAFDAVGQGAPGPRTPADVQGKFRVPLLLAYAKGDSSIMKPAEAKAFVDAASTTDKKLLILPGSAHGMALVADAREPIDVFLAKHTA